MHLGFPIYAKLVKIDCGGAGAVSYKEKPVANAAGFFVLLPRYFGENFQGVDAIAGEIRFQSG